MIVVLGDRSSALALGALLGPESHRPRVTELATDGASIAEIVATQLPRLGPIEPERVIVQLGSRDLVDGFDESYFHAQVVQMCDDIQRLAPSAAVDLLAVPLPPDRNPLDDQVDERRQQFNAAAEVTAELRGFRFHG